VSGRVTGDVRIAGQIATVSGKVDGSATLIAQTADITSAAMISRDVTITSQDSTVEGAISRDLEAIVGNNFTLNSPVGRDLDVTSPSVTLNDRTTVAGTFMYVSTANANVAEGVKVGRTEHKVPPKGDDEMMSPVTLMKTAAFAMAGFLVVSMALLLAAPRMLKAASHSLEVSPVGTVGAGLLGVVGLPFLAALCFATFIGVPLALVIFFSWAVSLLLGMVVTAYWLGAAVSKRFKWNEAWHDVLAMITGLAILFLLMLIPYIGGFVAFATVIWGAGALWYTAFTHRKGAPEVKK
jgi:cytoskeletal protein CcmA (bactofilin family)